MINQYKDEIIVNFFKNSINSQTTASEENNFIGYLCTYIPEEILISGGLDAIRIKGDRESSRAEGYLPINFCPYVKAIWEESYKKNDYLKSIVFATSCDGMRRLYDLFLTYKKETPAFMLDVPRNYDETSIDFYSNRLSKLLEFVQTLSPDKKIKFEDIKNSIEVVNEKRKLLSELTRLYEDDSDKIIPTGTYFNILDLAASSKNSLFIPELKEFLFKTKNNMNSKQIKPDGNSVKNNCLKIMVVGNYINDEKFWNIFNDLNIKIISSNLCISSRYFDFQVNLEDLNAKDEKNEINILNDTNSNRSNPDNLGTLLNIIAKSYMRKPFCFRMSALDETLKSLKSDIIKKNIKAVIFTSLKFCDNTLYFYPDLKSELEKLKIPSLYLDIEYGKSSYGQLRTRIEAFYEMME
ncbi:2-hydroxyacyl-CoA dehydratase family protein [bacterium]|nr:2-hydroxyacyl-CoA dehydratase family protein [bacterium]